MSLDQSPDLKIFAFHPDFVPKYETPGAVGMDLRAYLSDSREMLKVPGPFSVPVLRLKAGQSVAIPLGFAVRLPSGYELQIRPRSGASLKGKFIVILGTCDED